ncbi:PREDICTED: programmed cell death protein 4-like [Rhagoletis zephyria]|uniref:programmed cell death protein 4-like n=1 Tax=Rhagoletis zephyria TaxID=28612 RepID=UPI00081169C0|nr:PREDICTED: programmed cell death protein 4-like [Rhagoletis zephyria]
MATIVNSENGKDYDENDGYAASSDSEDESSTPLSSQVTNGVPVPERIKHHAKRPSKNGNHVAVPSDASPTEANMKKFMKNSRRSRGRFGRGLAKKGGAGGKGTWGGICEDYANDSGLMDPKDPNYDSDNMENCKIEAITPVLDEAEIERYVKPIITEYYEHGDTEEVINQLEDLNFGDRLHLAVVIPTIIAMERKSSHREMTSVLISDFYGRLLSQEDIERAFDVLLQLLPELLLDTPTADILLGNFIARAVADDCIPPIYVHRSKETYTEKPMRTAVEKAHQLLSTRHGLINVDQIWGISGGMRPVKYLIKQMHLILEEFVTSNVAVDAGDCLKDLEVPHFHHEFVYEAIVKAIEESKPNIIEQICSLLKYLYDSGIITTDQLKNGFLRVFEEMPDIVIDVPYAYELLDTIKSKSEKLGFFPEELEKQMPQRARKRFVSEGDGGLIKN